MTDRSKFEQMLEYLISEEQDKAREVFHQLVVEKSREIYESILAEELSDEDDEKDEEVDEGMQVTFSETDDEEDMGEMSPLGGEDDGEVGGDATDDFLGDIDADADADADGEGEMDMDGGEGEGELEDRVMDLEDALDDLRAEFEQMMGDEGSDDMSADEEGEEETPDFDSDEEPADEEGEEDEKEVKDSFDATAFMREYIEKVSTGHGAEKKSTGDNGSNTKSVIDNMKNDMGGTTANFARGGEAGGKGVESGLAKPTPKEENFGNINVPGGKAGKTAFKKREPGHGAERKGSGDNGDKSAGSPINGAPKRAR